MKVLVFNCGLLRLRGCCGNELLANPPFASERFERMPALFTECGADIIALSEIYEEEHVRRLQEALGHIYPYMARGDARNIFSRRIKFHNGLMFLSKLPILASRVVKHRKAARLEKVLGSKCMLEIKVDAGQAGGKLVMVNMHATAGGGLHPEQVDEVREDELREAIEACTAARAEGYKAMILGDLNMGPEASPANYDFMITNDYLDEVAACVDNPHDVCTWDPKNPLNKVGPHAECPPQRCDHVFVHKDAGLKGKQMALKFTEAMVTNVLGEMCTLSDHYGILLELQAS